MAVLWSAEEYIYQDGVLVETASLTESLTNEEGGFLYARVDDDKDGSGDDPEYSTNIHVGIEGIDFTDYNRVDIRLTTDVDAYFGSAYIRYGIGYQENRDDYTHLVDRSEEDLTDYTLTLDISDYTGKQAIYFYLYAKNSSSSYGAHAALKIFEIKLYNE